MGTVVVPRWIDEWGMLLFMVVVIGSAVLRPRRWLNLTAVVVCLTALAISECSLVPVARRLVHQRYEVGTWSRDYSDGVRDMTGHALTTARYIAVAGLGLALLAARKSGAGRQL